MFKTRKIKKNYKSIIKNLRYLLHYDDDIMTNSEKGGIKDLLNESNSINNNDYDAMEKYTKDVPEKASKYLPKCSHSGIREILDILAVALSVAFGARALFAQPFQIPTSSMQPTLFGIHYIEDTKINGKNTRPALPQPFHWMLYATQEAKLKTKHSGYISNIHSYSKYWIFNYIDFNIEGEVYTLPGNEIKYYKQLYSRNYKTIIPKSLEVSGWLSSGDHLFVDRVSHHFCGIRRGDITVFSTNNLNMNKSPSGFYYIKRLIGMPEDTLKIIDNMMYVKEKGENTFKPITDLNIKAINRIYSKKGGYHGHLPGPLLQNENEFKIPKNHYFMMGDNSANSFDSRSWGTVPAENIIGKAWFIFWPFSRRWGNPDDNEPLQIDTSDDLSSMQLQ